MQKPEIRFVAAVFIIICSMVINGCSIRTTHLERPQTIKKGEKPSEKPVEPFRYSDPNFETFTLDVQGLLKQRDFAGLEKMASDFRSTKKRFNGGGWKIYSFYLLTTSPLSHGHGDADWESHFKLLREWKEAFPMSIAARSSLANAHLAFAWVARGDEFADKVSDTAMNIFQERLKKAEEEIEEAAKLDQRCYGYFEVLLILGKAQSWSSEKFDEVFQEAVNYDRTYQYFYTAKATNLMPRWGGKIGEWEEFADNTKDSLGEPEGLKMYYQIVAEIHKYDRADLFHENRVSWESTKKGFELFEKEFGMTRAKLNEHARMAINAKDTQESCNTFKRLLGENDYDPGSWKTREGFESHKKIAMEMCKILKADNQVK